MSIIHEIERMRNELERPALAISAVLGPSVELQPLRATTLVLSVQAKIELFNAMHPRDLAGDESAAPTQTGATGAPKAGEKR